MRIEREGVALELEREPDQALKCTMQAEVMATQGHPTHRNG